MGNCIAQCKLDDKWRKAKDKIIKFDFDEGKAVCLTFERRFARENTNDKGEKLSENSARIVVRQFRIYMISVYRILQLQDKLPKSDQKAKDSSQYESYLEAPYAPSPMVGRVWDLLLTYTKVYEKFCLEVFGQILVRKKDVDLQSFNHYKESRKEMEKKKSHYNKFRYLEKVWPDYSQSQYKSDVESKSVVWLEESQIKQAKQFLKKQAINVEKKNPKEILGRNPAKYAQKAVKEYLKTIKRDTKIQFEDFKNLTLEQIKAQKAEQHKSFHDVDDSQFKHMVQQVNKIEFDETFINALCDKLVITKKFALRYIEEYRRFLFMLVVSKDMLTPSEQVDHVWHLHMSFNKKYVQDIKLFKKSFLHHNPTEGGQEESKKWDSCYGNTLKLYTYIFQKAPPADIWEDEKARFDMELLNCSYVDLHRLYCYQHKDVQTKLDKNSRRYDLNVSIDHPSILATVAIGGTGMLLLAGNTYDTSSASEYMDNRWIENADRDCAIADVDVCFIGAAGGCGASGDAGGFDFGGFGCGGGGCGGGGCGGGGCGGCGGCGG